MGLQAVVVRHHRGAVPRFLRPGGLRLRCRHADGAVRPRRRGRPRTAPPRRAQHHRAGLGRQRGLADHRAARRCSRRFPGWYATVFSTLYLPLLAILFGMIVRVVAIEWRGKIDDPKWRGWADFGIAAGSWLPAVLWGVAFAILVRGLPVGRRRPRPPVDHRRAQRLHAAGWSGHRRAVLVLRRGVRRVEDRRRDPRRRIPVRGVAVASRDRTGCGLWALDATGARQGLDVGWCWGRGGRAAGGGAVGVAARVRRLGVRCARRWWWPPW